MNTSSDPVTISDLTVRGTAAGDFVAAVNVLNAAPLVLAHVALVDNAAIPLDVSAGTVNCRSR